MALRLRQRGPAPAAMSALAILLAACGASSAISPSSETPTPSIEPNACSLLTDAAVTAALTPPPGSAAPTTGLQVTSGYSVEKVSVGGANSAGQCVWSDATTGARLIALVIPGAQLAKIADYVTGATKVGDAYIQEGSTRGFVSVQDGPDVIAITLVLDADASVRTARLADLARAASGAAIPSISAAPSSAAATPSGATASGPGEKVQGQTASVTVKESDELKFNPASVTVKAGQVVEWDNSGQVAHNVTFDAYQSITSDTMNGGDTYQVKFTQPGTYQYHCTFHPGMNGTITVQ